MPVCSSIIYGELHSSRVFMETESKPSIPPATGDPPGGGAPEPEKFTMYRELVAIIIVFLIIIAAVGFDFVEKSRTKSERLEQQLMGQLRTADQLSSTNFLTHPRGGAALDVYRSARKHFPDAPEVQESLQKLADRFLEIIAQLLEENELALAEVTIADAELVREVLQDKEFDRKLLDVRAELDRLRTQRDAAYKNSVSVETLGVIQDKLSDGGLGPALIFLPGGRFQMGAPPNEAGREDDEGPLIDMNIKAFAMGRTEVTFDEFTAFAEATGSRVPNDNGWGRGTRPVINVSWLTARQYALWLTRQTGYTYRLPSEAEWEFAARAGTTGVFGSLTCLDSGVANIDDRDPATYPACPGAGKYGGKTVPVGSYEPNPWGLHDMLGNVREWVQDCWYMNIDEKPRDGRPFFRAEGGHCGLREVRILRGGAWDASPKQARVASRFEQEETDASASAGFRVVREVY